MTAAAPKTVFIEIRDVPVSQLTPFPGNAKRGNVGMIKDSILEHDQYRALVVRHTPDDHLVVLAGNHTLQAIMQLGRPVVRCEIIACDDRTAKKINLVDNRSADTGTYDDEALDAILRGLEGDFAGTGYTPEDLMPSVPAPDEPVDVIQQQGGHPESSGGRSGPQTGAQRSGPAQRGTLCDHCPCRDT